MKDYITFIIHDSGILLHLNNSLTRFYVFILKYELINFKRR